MAKGIPVIKLSVYALLWYRFVEYERADRPEHLTGKRAILSILRITFNKDPSMIKEENVASFLGILKDYIMSKPQDYYIMREILKIMMVDPKTSPFLDVNSRNLLLAIICILVKNQENPDQDWYSVS